MTDPIAIAARFLLSTPPGSTVSILEAIRHHPAAEERLATIEACAGVVRGVASGPKERRYLGPCGAAWTDWNPDGTPLEAGYCEGAVYGGIGGKWATCRECGARYDQAARIAERAELAHSHWYTAAEIASAYPGVVLANTISKWRTRGRLTPRAEHDGHPLYAVADVLALAEQSREHAEAGAAT